MIATYEKEVTGLKHNPDNIGRIEVTAEVFDSFNVFTVKAFHNGSLIKEKRIYYTTNLVKEIYLAEAILLHHINYYSIFENVDFNTILTKQLNFKK